MRFIGARIPHDSIEMIQAKDNVVSALNCADDIVKSIAT